MIISVSITIINSRERLLESKSTSKTIISQPKKTTNHTSNSVSETHGTSDNKNKKKKSNNVATDIATGIEGIVSDPTFWEILPEFFF